MGVVAWAAGTDGEIRGLRAMRSCVPLMLTWCAMMTMMLFRFPGVLPLSMLQHRGGARFVEGQGRAACGGDLMLMGCRACAEGLYVVLCRSSKSFEELMEV